MEELGEIGIYKDWRGKNRDILEIITSRQSIRRYTEELIPDELIDKILEAARWAPTGENQQPWRLIVVRDPETKRKIGEFGKVVTGSWATASYCLGDIQPRFATIQDDEKRERVLKIMYTGQVSEFPGKAAIIIVVIGDLKSVAAPVDVVYDLSACIENMLLEAHSLGLGACWVAAPCGFPRRARKLKELLKIPTGMADYKTLAIVAFGWPESPRRYPRPKLSLEDIVYWEEFGNKVRR